MSEGKTDAEWWLYIISTAGGRYYTGISTDPDRRLIEHQRSAAGAGQKGAKALRGKGPLKMVYRSLVGNRSKAQKLEYKVKQLSKTGKRMLVDSQIPVIQYFMKSDKQS